MAKLTYSQLEGLWIQNGGSQAQAPLMAAIALAESGGNPNAKNGKDNGGKQSSYGLWQISTGTHVAPSPNWADPNVNAKLAMGKLKSQGLRAWGTYTSGAYKRFLANGVPPTSVGSSSALTGGGSTVTAQDASATVAADCAWNVHLPVAGNVCVATRKQVRIGLGMLIILGGLVVGVTGVILITVYGLDRSATASEVAGALT